MGRSSGGEGGAGGGGEGQGEADGGGIEDCSPGTIVWVRRRNGSWWPGRILGLDELPASQVVSPRTGTPVKLLGREDASIDWYNLEKSKRVKEFRCGEFDACIEKAKSCQPVKRREKYARREDAILHALELERKQLVSKYQNQGFRGREFDKFASEYYSRNNVQEPQLHLQSSAAQQVDLSTTRYKSKKTNNRKGNNSVLLGKTKDCEQKFIHAGSKRNLSGSLILEASGNTLSDHVNGFSHLEHTQGGPIVESGEKIVALKKRRLEEGLFEESLVKKHDRCRPLAQVKQKPRPFLYNDDSESVGVEGGKDRLPAIRQDKRNGATYPSTDFGDAHSHDSFLAKQIILTEAHHETDSYPKQQDNLPREQAFPDFVEKHESDSSASECSETETEDDAELLQRYAKIQSPEPDAYDPSSLHPKASNKLRHANDIDDDVEVAFSTHIPQLNVLEDEDGSSELGVSQWHMKGKRNQRSAVKKPIGKADENLSLDNANSFMKGSLQMANEVDSKMENIGASSHQPFGQFLLENQELDCDSDETDLVDKAASYPELDTYYGNDYPSSSKPTRDNGQSYAFNDSKIPCKTSLLNKNGDQISSVGLKACREGSSQYQRNNGSHLGSVSPVLFNVDLKVQANYQGEHVPLVSLMSKLNGKAIVGHPIHIEKLVEGSADRLVFGSDLVLEQSTAAAPAWPRGRRTAMSRVPRSNSSRATLDRDDVGGLWEMKAPFDRFPAPPNQQGVRLGKRNISSVQRPLSQKSQKRPSSIKKESSPSQKIRALSSVSIGKKHHREGSQGKAHRRSDILGGLLKSEGAVPLVTCVPVKVVFSRIMEALGRPSQSLPHRVRMAGPAIRDPP